MADTDMNQIGQFSIKVRKADWEIEVSAPDKTFVLEQSDRLMEQFRSNAATTISFSPMERTRGELTNYIDSSQLKTVKPQTLNEFFRQFRLPTHLEKILVLGYWLEIKQGQSYFTSEDILAKYKEAREQPPANIRRDLGTLVAKGLLLPPGKGDDGALTYALTNTGIGEVETKMPQA